MSEQNEHTNGSSAEDRSARFQGYSHYKNVSEGIAESIDEALSAYTELEGLHAEGAKVRGEQAARARSRIKLAALKLVPELRGDAAQNEEYQQMLARWIGRFELEIKDGETKTIVPEFPHDAPEGGYFSGLRDIRLQQQCPDWLEDWVIDIRTAGWEIGYLQAGRSVSPDPDLPDPDQEFERMFSDY